MSCLFCNIVDGKIPAQLIHSDEHVLAFRDIRPVAPTHVLVIPRKHISGVRDLTPEDAVTVGRMMLAAKKVAQDLGLIESGFRLVLNDGEDAGQTVHHVHLHVLGGRTMGWPPG